MDILCEVLAVLLEYTTSPPPQFLFHDKFPRTISPLPTIALPTFPLSIYFGKVRHPPTPHWKNNGNVGISFYQHQLKQNNVHVPFDSNSSYILHVQDCVCSQFENCFSVSIHSRNIRLC